MKSDGFVHLHLHTEYSLLDGACRLKELIAKIRELGQTAVAITDHGNMYGAISFWNEAKSAGIKPVIGCEVYVAPRSRMDKDPRLDARPFHLILLCENNEGYKNLIKLVSAANLEGFYNKPRVDKELLRKHSKGLICLSACLAGEIPRLLNSGEYLKAVECAKEYRDIFGKDNYFIEVQDHGLKDDMRVLPLLYRLSDETGIPLCATNDCHYIAKDDAQLQEILLCIQTGHNLGDDTGLSFETNEFYIKSADEMYELFRAHPEALENTVKIAERCNVDFTFGELKLPRFTMDGVTDNELFFRELCTKGMYEKYGDPVPKSVSERLEYEISVISQMGFVDYFLIVWQFINYARENRIPVGPGRGSGAGSLCAYCIGITGIDPIRFNLLFERFLNPERVSMPDFDIDFCIIGRQRVKDFVVDHYGADHVSEIIAFDTLKARAAIKDVGRALDISYSLRDKTAKLIDPKMTIAESLKTDKELMQLYQTDASVHKMIDYAARIEGMPRHTSVHAAGVVISAVPLSDLVPLQKNDNTIVTQYTAGILESLGLLKMDFLGLRNLTIINDAVTAIRRKIPDFDIDKIPTDDSAVYDMLSSGDTDGVFQLESEGMTARLMELRPERLEDLIVLLSLYRPGPMKSIPVYIENKRDPSKVRYLHPVLEDILRDTYGVMVYQEQVMEICRKAAGYSYGHADIVRRAMAKKKHDVMLKERESFVNGAQNNGIPADIANKIFDEMVSFASYAFNRSHAAAYAFLAYQTAYLKCRFKGEYMAALMTNSFANTEKLVAYIANCREHGIPVLPPDINHSVKGFLFEDGKMYFGLNAVKNVGEGLSVRIIQNRLQGGLFRSLQDFCERLKGRDLNRKSLENLIKAGAFDHLGLNRHQMLEYYERILDQAADSGRGVIEGQLNLLDSDAAEQVKMRIAYRPELDRRTMLAMEKEAAGIYLSGDPLSEYNWLASLLHVDQMSEIAGETSLSEGSRVKLLCMTGSVKQHITRTNDKMGFLELTDGINSVDSVIFTDLYRICASKLRTDCVVFVSGKISVKDEGTSVICGSITIEDDFDDLLSNMKICIKAQSENDLMLDSLKSICIRHPGKTRLCVYFISQRKTAVLNSTYTLTADGESYRELAKLYGAERIGLI